MLLVAIQDNGVTALWIASGKGHAEIVRMLLASSAAVNQGRTVSKCVGGGNDESNTIAYFSQDVGNVCFDDAGDGLPI